MILIVTIITMIIIRILIETVITMKIKNDK
jgi:hypothetical protein